MISAELLDILVCPDTKQPLRLASEEELRRFNDAVRSKALKTVADRPVEEEMDGALIREDGSVAYPIREDIPILLIEEGFRVGG